MTNGKTCTRRPECEHYEGHDSPCGKELVPGAPCDYCGKLTPLNGDWCSDCWSPITIADFKAIFAEVGYDTTVSWEQP